MNAAPSTATRTGRSVEPARAALFLREFLRNPLTTASMVPSSRALAAAMIPRDTALDVVVELGPGTGAFTRALQNHDRTGRHLALELNPALASRVTADFPHVEVITGAADTLDTVVASHQLTRQVDLVVSGLPWQAFAGPSGARLIPAIARNLRPGGFFTQFTYSWTRWAPPGRRQLEQLRTHFDQVQVSTPVWRNAPPATVYTCRAAGPR